MKLNTWTTAVILASLVAVIAIVAGLVWVGKDPASVIYLISAILVPTIASLLGVRKAVQTERKVDDVKGEVDAMAGTDPETPDEADDEQA